MQNLTQYAAKKPFGDWLWLDLLVSSQRSSRPYSWIKCFEAGERRKGRKTEWE